MPPLSDDSNMVTLDVTPSEMEVDFDKNLTKLYEAITNCDWDVATRTAQASPQEARTWVVRHYEEGEGGDEREIMWRFLPIHSACARQPPSAVVSAILKAYPDGAKCVDDQGMYPLHYACGNQASREVIRLLLMANPEAARLPDPRGMLPIHYLACWGPSSVSVIDMVLVANRDVAHAKDAEGSTPLDLAMEGDYPEREAVVAALKRWLENNPPTKPSSRKPKKSLFDVEATSSKDEKKESERFLRSPSSRVSEASASSIMRTGSRGSEPGLRLSRAGSRGNESEPRFRLKRTGSRGNDSHQGSTRSAPITLGNYRSNSRSNLVVEPPSVTEPGVEALREELAAVKRELKEKEESWQQKLKNLEGELEESRSEVANLQMSLQDQASVDRLSSELDAVQAERDGLQTTLCDLMEQNDSLKQKYDSVNGQLIALKESICAMLEQQQEMAASLKEKEEKQRNDKKLRSAKLKELLDLEASATDTEVFDDTIDKQLQALEKVRGLLSSGASEPAENKAEWTDGREP